MGERVTIDVSPRSESIYRYSCRGQRGLSRGVARLFIAVLIVELEVRLNARPVKVVVGVTWIISDELPSPVPIRGTQRR